MNRTTFCRTCGRGGLVYSVALVHQSEVTGQTVLQMLEYGVGLKLIDDGVFPSQICRLCYGQIVATYELKRTSIESQNCFMQWFPSETLVGVATNAPPEETAIESEKIAQTEEFVPADVPRRPEIASPTVECSVQKEVIFTEKEVHEAIMSGISAEIVRRAKGEHKTYACKYCIYETFDKMEYMAHYSVHPTALCCVCGFVTNRKFSLRRHLKKYRCNDLHGNTTSFPRVRFSRKRKDHDMTLEGVSIESDNLFVDETLEQEEIFSQYAKELASPDRSNTEPEELLLDASELVIEAVKIEPEDDSITQYVPKLNEDPPMLEHAESSTDPLSHDNTELDEKIYTCGYCPFTTLIRKDYLFHYKHHPRVLRCVCGFLTDTQYSLRRHVSQFGCDHSKYSHNGKIYMCRYCSYISTNQADYVLHCRTHPKYLRCLCGFTTDRIFSLKRHLKSAKCEETYGKKMDWEDYNERRSRGYLKNKKTFQLSWIGVGKPLTADAAPYNQNETNGYKCSQCAHISNDRLEYFSHYKTHPKRFQCFCGFETDRKFTFQRHLTKRNCEKVYGKKMDFGPKGQRKRRKKLQTKTQSDSTPEAVSLGLGLETAPFEVDLKLEEERLQPQDNIAELAVHDAFDTERENLSLDKPGFLLEVVKVEPEEASVVQDILKLEKEYPTLEATENETEPIGEDNPQMTRKIYTCTYCPFTTRIRTDYLFHYRGHPRVLRCACGFMTDKQFALQRHVTNSGCNMENCNQGRLKSSRQRKVFKCRYCSYSSTNRDDYVMHWKYHPKILRCLCGFTTDRKFSLVRHLRTLQCETIYGKMVDWEAYQQGARAWLRHRTPFEISWIEMENHEIPVLEASDQSEAYKCSYCSYTTQTRQKFLIHKKTHPMNYHCFCGFETDRKYSFQRHLEKKRCEQMYGKKYTFAPTQPGKRSTKKSTDQDHTESTSSKQFEELSHTVDSADLPPGSAAAVVDEGTANVEESSQEHPTKLEHHEVQVEAMNVDLNE